MKSVNPPRSLVRRAGSVWMAAAILCFVGAVALGLAAGIYQASATRPSGTVVAASDVLPTGDEATLDLDLPPGSYQLTCRIVVQTDTAWSTTAKRACTPPFWSIPEATLFAGSAQAQRPSITTLCGTAAEPWGIRIMNRQPDMRQLLQQAQKMQEQLAAAQEELAGQKFDGSAGGGVVTATVSGAQHLVSVAIDPSVVDPDDVEMLQDLVVAAVNQAMRAASDAAGDQFGGLAGGLDLGGLLG